MVNTVKHQSKVATKELWRLLEKSVKANVGQYEISEESASAAMSVFTSYRQQDREQHSNAGKVSKLRKGILLATRSLLSEQPDISPSEAWDYLCSNGWDSDEYDGEVFGDGEKLVQRENRGNVTHESEIKYGTFKSNYYPKAKN